ncbi:hypothetical protein QM716_11965 [Rhodococcus sp. IEGM 1409]|uniref:hypothetical protein n=1 Tax=Rhodococcus sp. IEGM 1409 TaxID=3047082 RepID=UPI0024B68823|nr:hypothetical protein [Rhodococcus sp. IEGM 1409]MDI9900568.1 hypothetical protein [Rhodococcus sp. IEGM 1409]
MSFDPVFEKNVHQKNVIDGTVLIFEVVPGKGAYVTVKGRDAKRPTIIAFDQTDLEVLAGAVLPRVDGRILVADKEDASRVTRAGVEVLPKLLDLGNPK